MQNIFKKSLLAFTLITTSLWIVPNAVTIPKTMLPAGAPRALPSVADVFGGLSEQEIAQQVQMGQQFLEDLQKNGTPQEIAEFNKLLSETLNSMSEDDLKDIQAIAQMVEPHITTTAPEELKPIKPIDQTTLGSTDTTVATSDLEEFKKLIGIIIQRIDDIFQKINSSKECAEQVDAKWKNKSTFNNMKRQMYQLKTDRLAQKLCKKDIKDDDKKLVVHLKDFLKHITEHNENFVIEDDFGLPTSFTQEQKHLKQTKKFIEFCDDSIDTLMPELEKFLQKWDPEALQIAKETEARSKKAAKDAFDATARKPSLDSRAKSAGTTGGYNPSYQGSGYPDYGGYYPEQYGGSASSAFPENEPGAPQSSEAKKAKDKPEINAGVPTAKEKQKDKNNLYDYAMNELEGHVTDDFDAKHENDFADFMQNNITNYPDYTLVVANGALTATLPPPTPTAAGTNISTTNSTPGQENNWIDSKPPFPLTLTSGITAHGFADYAQEIKNTLEDKFYPEFAPLTNILEEIQNNISNMITDDLKKLSTSKELANIENRLKRYKKTFEDALPKLADAFNKNTTPGTANAPGQQPGMLDPNAIQRYQNVHDKFVDFLHAKIGEPLDKLLHKINTIKKSAKRTATKKSSQKTS